MGILDTNVNETNSSETVDNTTLGANNGSYVTREGDISINAGNENPQAPFFPELKLNQQTSTGNQLLESLLNNKLLMLGAVSAGVLLAYKKLK